MKDKTFMTLLLISLLYRNFSREIRRVERCPSRAERLQIRKLFNCTSNEVYHCLLDEDGFLKETCNAFIQLPPGYFPRYSTHTDRVYYTSCSSDRYQPGPVKSNEITNCELKKSTCSGLGQVVCNNGSTVKDLQCGCDYRLGYVPGGSSSCCSPSESADCYCSIIPCNDDNHELNADYQCVKKCQNGYFRPDGKSDCENISDSVRIDMTTQFTILKDRIFEPEGFSVSKMHPVPTGTIYKVGVATFIFLFFIVFFVSCFFLFTHKLIEERKTWDEKCEEHVYELINAANKGDLDTVKSYIDGRLVGINDTDINGRSALHLAACEGHVHVVEFLLSKQAVCPSTKDRCMEFTSQEDAEWHFEHVLASKDTLGHYSKKKTYYEETISKLKGYKGPSSLKLRTPKTKLYLKDNVALQLVKAAETNDITELQRLFKLKTEMNLADSSGKTALHIAAEQGSLDIITFLVNECEVSPFARSKNGERPVDLAKSEDSKHVLQSAMDDHLNCKPEVKDTEDETPTIRILEILKWASDGNLKNLKKFSALDYDLSLCNYDMRTALHVAVSFNQEHVVEYLLKEGKIKENVEDRWQITPLMLAKERGKRKIFRLFLDLCPNVVNTESDEYKTYCLLMAGKNGDVEILKRYNKNGVDMSLQDYDGRTALHLAFAENQKNAINFLLECGCSGNITDRYGRTAIDKETIKRIESIRRDKNIPTTEHSKQDDRSSDTKKERVDLTSYFAQCSTLNSLQIDVPGLKEKYTKPQITDKSNMYVIFEAAAKGDLDTLEKCDYPFCDAVDYFKNTPLHVAASVGHMNIVQYLIKERNASPFIRNSIRKRPVDLVEDGIKCLVSTAATLENLHQRQRFTKVKSFLLRKSKELSKNVSHTLDKSFHIYDEDVQVFMLLNKTYKGDIMSVRGYLLQNSSLINKQDYDGRTALHVAVAEIHDHLVQYFLTDLKDEIDINIKDRWGNTPLQEATRYNLSEEDDPIEEYENIMRYLKNFKNDQ